MSERTVLLGVSGGIAAYKAAELVRLFRKAGLRVHVAMTRNATEFITPLTLETLSGNAVWVETFRLGQEREIGHIGLVDRSDLFLVAPATANIIGKTAAGIADDLLSTLLCVACRIPVVFAPSMNVNMYENPITQANIERLKSLGYDVVEPELGALACGDEGVGRLAEPAAILEHILFRLSAKDLEGEHLLGTAGPTQEEIDPVRFLSNPSSGKMGFAVARAAALRGAAVTLVTGPTHCTVPRGVHAVHVRSAEQMRQAVLAGLPIAPAVVMTAAVSDFRPVATSPGERQPDPHRIRRGDGIARAERGREAPAKEPGPDRGERCFPHGDRFPVGPEPGQDPREGWGSRGASPHDQGGSRTPDPRPHPCAAKCGNGSAGRGAAADVRRPVPRRNHFCGCRTAA